MRSRDGAQIKDSKPWPGRQPGIGNNAVPSGPPAKEEYKVGPGRPPKEHQFKPGQSGNPKGAKRKAPSLIPALKELFEHAFSQKVKVTRGEQEQSITMWAPVFNTFPFSLPRGTGMRVAMPSGSPKG